MRLRRVAGPKAAAPKTATSRKAAPRSAASKAAAPSATGSAAATAIRCAALLRGGMQGTQLEAALLRESHGPEIETLRDELAAGASLGAAFSAVGTPEWRVLGAAWSLAEVSGAPFAPVLDRIALALRSMNELSRKREVLLAGPRTTVRLIAWLPIVAIGVGFLFGFDPLPVFLTPFGAGLLVVGFTLQLAGIRWARALTARVEAEDRVAGLECELMWIALSGGASPESALPRVADAVSDHRAEWIEFRSLCRGEPLDRALREATRAGVPASSLLQSAASEERAKVQARLETEAERLSVRILIPLAVCILPAFVILGVVPVIITLFGGLLVA